MTDRTDVLLVFADPVIYPSAQPYGLMILQSALEARGIRCETILPFYRSNPAAYTRDSIARSGARIVGYSFRNLDSAGFHFSTDGSFSFVGHLLGILPDRKTFDGIVALGGSGFSIAPTELMEITQANIL